MNKKKFLKIICVVVMLTAIALTARVAQIKTSECELPYPSEEYTMINNTPVYFIDSVNEKDTEWVTSLIEYLPSYLLEPVNSINIIEEIENDSTTRGLSAFNFISDKNGKKVDIYIRAYRPHYARTIFHEVGHVVDCYNYCHELSTSRRWRAICKAEWADQGYYSSPSESFAAAVSAYIMEELDPETMPMSLEYMKELLPEFKNKYD